ncbi:MAG: FkbM family methyltransferase [Clostridia bacterium]|nr:FkbM family methyltransferase [Clostridia bacterium]
MAENKALPNPESVIDVWQYLAGESRPILIYGMGNGADKLLSQFEKYSIPYADFFASDGFVRGHSFHGKRVLSFSEVLERYGDFVIAVSFASNRREVIDRIKELSATYDVIIPDMPVAGDAYFTSDFYREHYSELLEAYNSLADERSREVFAAAVRFKLTGRYSHLDSSYSQKDEILSLIDAKSVKGYIDAGAYNGDTVRELLDFGARPDKILAVEPDTKTYRRLLRYIESEERVSIDAVNAALWSEENELVFSGSGNRNSSLLNSSYQHTDVSVSASTLDSLTENYGAVDYVKYDVEGAEKQALLGSVNTLNTHRPRLLVSCYHRSEDLYELVLLLKNKFRFYDIYLRKTECFPAWELNILAVPRSFK